MKLLHAFFAIVSERMLRRAVDSVQPLWPHSVIIDNSADGFLGRNYEWPCPVVRPSVPLTWPQTMNFLVRLAEEGGADVFSWQHHDAIAHEGVGAMFLEAVERVFHAHGRWGAVLTSYDLLSAYNVNAVQDIGLWETEFPISSYSADADWFHRCRLKRWEIIETGLQLTHWNGGSNTLRHSKLFSLQCEARSGMNSVYYRAKWGGEPDHETFLTPWNGEHLDAATGQKIYDCFIFNDELDLLEIRLNELDTVVDRFVICESTRTHSNQTKPLYFADNIMRYEPFLGKMTHLVFDPGGLTDAWAIENAQRRFLIKGLASAANEDYFMLSDVDELPRAEMVRPNCKAGLRQFEQKFSYYHVNRIGGGWHGTRLLPCSLLPFYDNDLQKVRKSIGTTVANGGWHFSYLGGVERIQRKLASFAHCDLNVPRYNSTDHLLRCLDSGSDIFDRAVEWKLVESLSDLPAHLLANRERYAHLFYSRQH